MKSLIVWIVAERSSASGGSDSLRNVWRGWKKASARDGPGLFPPEVVVQVKALACELPSGRQQPLSRWSVAEIAAQARRSGLVATISDSTVWRWLTFVAVRRGPGMFLPGVRRHRPGHAHATRAVVEERETAMTEINYRVDDQRKSEPEIPKSQKFRAALGGP